MILKTEGLVKLFRTEEVETTALDQVNLTVEKGEFTAIMGPSGCGKSTLMNLLGCMDRPTEGRYLLGGQDVSKMEDDELSSIRGARLGFVFQSYNLIQQLTVVENIEVPLYYQGRGEAESRERAIEQTARVRRDREHRVGRTAESPRPRRRTRCGP